MTYKQAMKFLQNFVTETTEQGKIECLQKYYSPNVIGHYNNKPFDFDDIKNRIDYIKKRYRYHKHHILELNVIDNGKFLVYRTHQTGYDTFYKKLGSLNSFVVNRINNNLISEVWLMVNMPLDYFADSDKFPSESPPTEKVTIDELERRDFMQMLEYVQSYQNEEIEELTLREIDCLFHFFKGLTAKETARILDISHRTVEEHLSNIRRKYDCLNKFELREKVFNVAET